MESSVINRFRPSQPDPSGGSPNDTDASSWRQAGDNRAVRTPFWQLMITLWLSKWFILLIAIVGGLLTGMLGLSRPVLYEAKAQLITSSPSVASASGATTVSQESINETIDSHLTRLVSQAQLRRVIATLEIRGEKATLAALRKKAESTGMVSAITVTLRKWTTDLGNLFNTGQTSTDEIPADKDVALLTTLRSGLRVGQELRSRVISIGYTDTDRVNASIVANSFAQAYVEQLTNQSRAAFERDLAAVDGRIPGVQRELAEAIAKKEKYLIATGGTNLTDGGIVNEEISQLKQLLSVTKTSLATAKSRPTDGLVPSKSQENQPALKGQADEVQYFETQIASLESRINHLETTANEAANRLSGLHALELEIDAESNQYKDILAKRETLRQHAAAPSPGISILSAAWAPTEPKTISPIFLVPPGIILFGLLAAIIAVLRNSFEDTIRSDAESEEALGIQSAGMLPKLNGVGARDIKRLVLGQTNSPYRRALSSIFVGLAPHHANAKFSKLVLVTSSTQSDGKTELAWGLAASAKRFGHHTLFIDLDTREDRLTRSFRHEFGAASSVNNFADFAEGRCTLHEAVTNLPEVGLDFMSAPSDSAELLARLPYADIQHSIEKMCQEYSFVIVNGPTGSEAPELRLLASQADAVLFAVRWGKTKRTLARAALRIFTRDSGDATIIRSVLTNVNLRQQKQYYFGDSADLLRSNR